MLQESRGRRLDMELAERNCIAKSAIKQVLIIRNVLSAASLTPTYFWPARCFPARQARQVHPGEQVLTRHDRPERRTLARSLPSPQSVPRAEIRVPSLPGPIR